MYLIVINNPNKLIGKILIKYTGKNLNILDNDITIDRIVLGNETIDGYDAKLVFKINLFDNNKILLSLKTFVIYVEKNEWEVQESSLNSTELIIVDNEYVIVKGNFSFCNEIDEINRYLDTYEYDIIFKNTNALVSKLQEEDLTFIDLRTT